MVSKTIRDLEGQLALREQQLEAMRLDVEALKRALAIMQDAEQHQEEELEIPPAKVIRNTMVDILQGAGKPMHYSAIFDELRARGVVIPGKDPKKNVGAHLSIDDRFKKQGGGLWGLQSWERPIQGASNVVEENQSAVTVTSRDRNPFKIERAIDGEREPTTDELEGIRRMADEHFESFYEPHGDDGPGWLTVLKKEFRPVTAATGRNETGS